MQPQQQQYAPPMSIEQFHNFAINVVELVCSVFTMPVEIILHPQYGTQYFPIPVAFFSSVLMILLPAFASLANGLTHMIPFSGPAAPPPGLFGIGSLSALYFFLMLLHGLRLWRRMVYMELEKYSRYEGPPLPFFRLIPGSRSYWCSRIVLEPVFVFVLASVLENILLIQSGLSLYLHLSALMLVMRNFIGWFKHWKFIRDGMDNRIADPILAKLVENRASEEELASIHLAGFPKNLPPDLRKATAIHIARSYDSDIQIPATGQEKQEEKQ